MWNGDMQYQRICRDDYYKERVRQYCLEYRRARGTKATQLVEIAEIYSRTHSDEEVRCYPYGDIIHVGHRHIGHKMPEEIGLLI